MNHKKTKRNITRLYPTINKIWRISKRKKIAGFRKTLKLVDISVISENIVTKDVLFHMPYVEKYSGHD